MKLSESALKRMIKEVLKEDMGEELAPIVAVMSPELERIMDKILDKLGDLDVSIDYLAAATTGERPEEIAATQSFLGRGIRPRPKTTPEER